MYKWQVPSTGQHIDVDEGGVNEVFFTCPKQNVSLTI